MEPNELNKLTNTLTDTESRLTGVRGEGVGSLLKKVKELSKNEQTNKQTLIDRQ